MKMLTPTYQLAGIDERNAPELDAHLLASLVPGLGPVIAGSTLAARMISTPRRNRPRPRGFERYGMGVIDPVTATLIAQGVMAAGTAIFGWISKRGKQKVAATQIVNEAERHLQANVDAYSQAPPTPANQQQALNNFEQVWGQVLASCGDPALGDAGRRCVSERDRGGQWDWFARYRDPIANDDRVATGPAPASTPFSPLTHQDAGAGWLLPLGLIAAGALML